MVGHDLKLNVTRIDNVLFKVHGVVIEGVLCLTAGGVDSIGQSLGIVDYPHPLSPATGGGLDHNRVSCLLSSLPVDVEIGLGSLHTGNQRDTGIGHLYSGCHFVAKQGDGIGRRPDKRDLLLGATSGEERILGQKTIAGMDGVAPGLFCSGDDLLYIKV